MLRSRFAPDVGMIGTAPRAGRSTSPLAQVGLEPLMALGYGHADVAVGLLDGPVASSQPALAGAQIQAVGECRTTCTERASEACAHGTFVAGMLVAHRGSPAPAICPGCPLLLRSIFREEAGAGGLTAVLPAELASAIVESVDAGARVLNLSASTAEPSVSASRELVDALDYATRRGALVVAATGNQGMLGTSTITRHPGVIPVAGYDAAGRPLDHSNLARTIGRRGLGAPGAAIESLGLDGMPVTLTGTSFATPFVTGAIALLWSMFRGATATEIRNAVMGRRRRTAVAPPLLDAADAYWTLAARTGGR